MRNTFPKPHPISAAIASLSIQRLSCSNRPALQQFSVMSGSQFTRIKNNFSTNVSAADGATKLTPFVRRDRVSMKELFPCHDQRRIRIPNDQISQQASCDSALSREPEQIGWPTRQPLSHHLKRPTALATDRPCYRQRQLQPGNSTPSLRKISRRIGGQ